MSETAVQVDIREIVLSNNTFGPVEIGNISRTINEDYSQFMVLRDSVGELEIRDDRPPAAAARLGVCYFLLGRYPRALETLSNSDGGALALFYAGRSLMELEKLDEAIQKFQAAQAAGYSKDVCTLAIASAERARGHNQEAMKLLDDLFGPVEQTAEYLFQRATTVAAIGGNPEEVVRLLERAVEADGRHAGALFGLAKEHDRRGNDSEALTHYKRAVNCFPAHVGSLLNLGILYEDLQQFENAKNCYKRVLDVYPGHPQARLYMKDALASTDQFINDEDRRESERLRQILNTQVMDFELSVRSRNCLKNMGIRTLGDLTRTTEQELLQSKNFGETSLIEIREILGSKSLELGQFAHERQEPEPTFDTGSMSPDEKQLLDRPIADLNLSVRARKCMVRLGMTKIGELVRRTGDDLLECKNFGVTSLNEIRERLGQMGMKLRGD